MDEATLSEEDTIELAEVFQGLASPTRLRVLLRLRRSPCSVNVLADELETGQATLSNHLRVLRHARLVAGEREGRSVTYRLFDGHVTAFLDQALQHLGHTEVDETEDAPEPGVDADT